MATGRVFSQVWETPFGKCSEGKIPVKNPRPPTLDESGATAIEYALIATLVVVVLITALNLLSSDLSNTFNTIANSVTPVI